jgi:Tol biopolymer transport system component/imidazolonepropionase-like amidohydrolase
MNPIRRGLVVALAALAVPAALDARPHALVPQDTAAADTTTSPRTLPLAPGRTVAITTDEASWLSLDVSPDGRTIVFDVLGDIYTVPLEGGEATAVTSGMAFDGQPRYSPDGTRIVITSDRSGGENLWILDLATGDSTQLTTEKHHRYQSPAWSPDGNYIVASRTGMRSGSSKLRMWHVDGGSGQALFDEPDNLKALGAAFSPDGRTIWFAQRTGNWQYNAIYPQYQLATFDRVTGRRTERSSRFGSGLRPTLSPDGRWLVYGTRYDASTGLVLRDLESGEESWLAYPVQRDDQESRATRDVLPGMAFTPDSRELVVSYGGKIWRVPIDGSAPIAVPFTVSVELELGPKLAFAYDIDDAPQFAARQIRDIAPSPDGARLAFVAMDRLYVMALPDGDPQLVTARRADEGPTVEAQPTWSPDGRWLAYVTWSDRDGGHLYRVRADGRARPERLTTRPAIYQTPAWSPDGERIVMLSGPARAYREATGPRPAGAAEAYVWVSASGGEATTVTPAGGLDWPHFSADAGRIFFTAGSRGLVSMRWDGTDERTHLEVRGIKPPDYDDPPDADEIRMAPVGDRAVARVRDNLYVVTAPLVGGDAPTIDVSDPDRASFPARKLTDIGGQFPRWSADAGRMYWAVGNALVTYDVAAAEADTAYVPFEHRVTVMVDRDIPRGSIVLRGGRVVTMRGDEVLEGADVVVTDNRIVAVGARGAVAVPDGAEIVDVAGKTIVPGFVDVHAHMRPAWGIHRTQAWAFLANLAHGVTTTRDPQTSTTDVLTYADQVDAGALVGPRIYSTGPGVFWEEQITSLEHARDVMRRYSTYYDTKTIKMYVAGNREMRQWIIQAAREQEIMPTTEGSLNFKMNLTQIVDGYPGHEHSFPVFPLYEDFVTLAAQSGVTYTPTLLVAYGGPWAENYWYVEENPHDDPKVRRFVPHAEVDRVTRRRGSGTGPGPGGWFMDEEHVFRPMAKVAKDIVEAGGRAGVGSHGQFQGLAFHWELWSLASGGMTSMDALRAATIFGAEAIGLQEELGSIEAGKLADLVVLDGNPLDDLRHTNTVRYVMKNGRLHDGETLDEIYPRQRAMEIPAHWSARPAPRAGIRP